MVALNVPESDGEVSADCTGVGSGVLLMLVASLSMVQRKCDIESAIKRDSEKRSMWASRNSLSKGGCNVLVCCTAKDNQLCGVTIGKEQI